MRSLRAARKQADDGPPNPRPLLIIDKRGRIQSAIAADTKNGAVQHCWEILRCGAASRRACNAIQCLTSRGPSDARCGALSAAPQTNACLITALPGSELLVWGPRRHGAANWISALQFVCSLAGNILTRDLRNGAETVLEMIRIATMADNCALFLADLHGKELFLSACVGPDADAIAKRARLECGEGVAGVAFAQRRQILQRAVLAPQGPSPTPDPDLLSVICIPVPAPDGHEIGVLELAWRSPDPPFGAADRALCSAVMALGNAICASYWSLRQRVVASVSGGSERPLLAMAQAIQKSSSATSGHLVIWSESTRKALRIESFGSAPPVCPWLNSPHAAPCSSRENESCFRLVGFRKGEQSSPGPCRQAQFEGSALCCIPVTGQPGQHGRMLLSFENDPTHPLRALVPLQVMAQEMALRLQPAPAPASSVDAIPYPPLQIRCFGHFEVAIGDKKLSNSSFARRDALTLLKILVLRAGKQVHRSRLIEWLWPEIDESTGRNRLHGVVHALRNAIEPFAAERRWIYVLKHGEAYSFCPSGSSSIDLISFQQFVASAMRNLRTREFAPNTVYYLEQAVELYRGDLYEDDQDGEWCDVERTALQREFIEALVNLARTYLTIGEGERAINTLRRALTYDPSREDLHTELTRCLMRFRRHKEAQEQIRACVHYLRSELAIEPSSETSRLFHTLLGKAVAHNA